MSDRDASTASVVVIGPTPPPYHGVAVMTPHLVDALGALDVFSRHVDTRDRQPIETLGQLNVNNLLLGFRHAWQLHRALTVQPSGTSVILPISQGKWGFLRDTVFVLVLRLHRQGLIIHLHGGELDLFYQKSGRLMQWLIRRVFAQADQAWALTPGLKHIFDGLVSPERVSHLENVVSDGTADVVLPDLQGSSDARPFVFLYLANLRKAKGVFDLMDALQRVGSKAQHWEVRIVGAGAPEEVASLRGQASALARAGGSRVKIQPPQFGVDKWSEFLGADAFVFPPRAPEGQPLVLLEAMAAGLPIVSTRIGGIPDTVRDGSEAILVEPGKPAELAVALERMAADSDMRNELGRGARARYESRYSPDHLRRNLARLFGIEPHTAKSEHDVANT